MKDIKVICACTDLGVNIDGASLGPEKIVNFLKINNSKYVKADKIQKENETSNKKKNINSINKFNEELYNVVVKTIKNNEFPVTLGGDHSISIASGLASINNNEKLGVIWIDAHGDFNTFETTITGNIHGLPLATLAGYGNEELRKFHCGNCFLPENTVIVGGRDYDEEEVLNLKKAGVTIFSTEDIKQNGVENVMKEAFKKASEGTNGIHVSLDLDVIDPKSAMGVSVPVQDGISVDEVLDIAKIIKNNAKIVKSLDLVEYNPLKDKNNQTLEIISKIWDNLF